MNILFFLLYEFALNIEMYKTLLVTGKCQREFSM